MNKTAPAAREQACEVRLGQVGIAQVRVRTLDADAVYQELASRVAVAPHLFNRTGVCLDFSALDREPEVEQARALLDAVRRAGMLPVGLARGTERMEPLSRAVELPLLTQHRLQTKNVPAPTASVTADLQVVVPPSAAPAPVAPAVVKKVETPEPGSPALLHTQPVRSGQRVYARQRDLILTAPVGAGAEVMADGCVHIYSSLRGRALAGARGDVSARVFCQEFNAELVSIAGVFRVFETIPKDLAGKPVQAWLEGEDLKLARIGS